MTTEQRFYVDTAVMRFRSGYREVNALLAVPSVPQPMPAIMLAHDVYGLDEHIDEVVIRLAREGYAVMAPDFYTTKGGSRFGNALASRRTMLTATPDPLAVSDINKGYNYLKGESFIDTSRVAVMGFGFGGTVALLAASQNTDFAAAVNFYGDVVYPKSAITRGKPYSPVEMIPLIKCPILSIYGGPDEDISREDLALYERRLREKSRGFDLKVYPNAKNGFFNDRRPEVYQPKIAQEALSITLNWLKKQLG